MSDDLGWFKYLGHEDNWEHCPVRVDTAKEHFVNSRCLYDRQSGHNEAKWREASALIGLTEAETEAVIAMQFHESESDESPEGLGGCRHFVLPLEWSGCARCERPVRTPLKGASAPSKTGFAAREPAMG